MRHRNKLRASAVTIIEEKLNCSTPMDSVLQLVDNQILAKISTLAVQTRFVTDDYKCLTVKGVRHRQMCLYNTSCQRRLAGYWPYPTLLTLLIAAPLTRSV